MNTNSVNIKKCQDQLSFRWVGIKLLILNSIFSDCVCSRKKRIMKGENFYNFKIDTVFLNLIHNW